MMIGDPPVGALPADPAPPPKAHRDAEEAWSRKFPQHRFRQSNFGVVRSAIKHLRQDRGLTYEQIIEVIEYFADSLDFRPSRPELMFRKQVSNGLGERALFEED